VTHRVLGPLPIEFELEHFLVDVVVAGGSNICNFTPAPRGDKDAVFGVEAVLVDAAEDVALGEDIALLDARGLELPQLGGVQRRHVHALRHVHRLRVLRDHLQRTLDAVKDLIEDTGAEFD
jgi:hypothetical protein